MFYDNWFRRGTKKEVMLLRPNDTHFADIKIVDEKDKALESPKIKGVTRFFLKKKGSKGWTNDKGGGSRYFGLEGYDFTLKVKETEQAVIGLYDAVKIVLTPETMKTITPEIKEKLEGAKFCVTTEPIIDEGINMPNEGNEAGFTEVDKANIKAKGEATAKAAKGGKMEWMPILMGLFLGVIIGIALVSFKVIKVG